VLKKQRRSLSTLTMSALAIVAMFVGTSASTSLAAPFTELVVFGDSHSDTGNYIATSGVQPSPPLFNGRWSNGPLWIDYLSRHLALPPVASCAAGGKNYAYAGAQTGNGGMHPLHVGGQVDLYLAEHSPSGCELFVLFAGHNDLVRGTITPEVPLANLSRHTIALAKAGAKHILVVNLPPLEHLSVVRLEANDHRRDVVWNSVREFNQLLACRLEDLQTQLEIRVYRFDLFALVLNIITNPASFGLVNVIDRADIGEVPNANQYLYWARHHYTTAAHRWFGQKAFEVVVPTYNAQPLRFQKERFSIRRRQCVVSTDSRGASVRDRGHRRRKRIRLGWIATLAFYQFSTLQHL
jgi:phospholipase/lecithinase/hemolysin